MHQSYAATKRRSLRAHKKIEKLMHQLAKKADTQALKEFARTMIWAFPAVFGLLLPWIFDYAWQWWPLAISAILALFYAFKPSLIYYPYRAWMGIALALGWVNTRIILGFTFFVLILPFGVVLRALKKLQYRTAIRSKANCSTYYHTLDEKRDYKRLEFPF